MWTIFDALAQKEAEDSRRAAEDKNTKLLKQWNEDMFRYQDESRGSTGLNSVLLRNPALEGAETKMAGDVMGWYDAANAYYGSPEDRLNRFAAAASKTSSAVKGAGDAVNDLYSGQLTSDRLASVAPVMQARTNLARTNREGFLSALRDRLNALEAGERAKGYSGLGSFGQNRLLGASVGANQMAAAIEAQAALDNAAQVYGIQDDTRQLQIQNVNLPYQLAEAGLKLEALPVVASGQSYMAQQAPFSMFNTGYIAPPYGALQGPLLKAPKKTGTQIAYEGLHEGSNDILDLAMTAASMYFGGGLGGGMADFSDNKASTAGAPAGTTTVGGKSYSPAWGSMGGWGF